MRNSRNCNDLVNFVCQTWFWSFHQVDVVNVHGEETAVFFRLFIAGEDTTLVPAVEAQDSGVQSSQATSEAKRGDIAEGNEVRLYRSFVLLLIKHPLCYKISWYLSISAWFQANLKYGR